MSITRRGALGAALALPFIGASQAQAQSPWAPNRPVRIVVPFQGGGATDLTARLLAERLTPMLGQPVVVDNRPGAGGNLGADMVAKSDPDGHTLLMCTIGTASINQFLYSRMPYRQEDLAAVALANLVANGIMVNANLPVRNLAELLAYAKANPGKLNYGTPGNGTSGHLCGEYLKVRAGIQMTHVPYRGTGGVIPDLIAGNIDLAVDNLPAYLPHGREGRMKILAVTSKERWFALPEVPTVQESGISDFEAVAWFGVQAPARMPRPILQRYATAIAEISRIPEVVERQRSIGAEPHPLGPDEFAAFIAAENTKWQEVVRLSGARLD
ncbi:Bug family tripartite tricarboxylate transporter substrate binding protein [Falsiroseomonas tokyonensis]|uniref:Bug family tripartite tricarboxylate transporter substrate binding protein n=1 Tax=Falsiroseomonas tokyonensis TaxID=430521 RepID=A0ABV7BRE9_9PROT|nr:tripartite tricarboxylate transporter substrate binding protein [Falsiroseomonas tokyonensis]MBU8537611.1 tripartite tricarboxylate transporter substrate binding protein [Falsiroseomonas tokyonensis]